MTGSCGTMAMRDAVSATTAGTTKTKRASGP